MARKLAFPSDYLLLIAGKCLTYASAFLSESTSPGPGALLKITLLKPSEENLVPSLAKRVELTVINIADHFAFALKSSLTTLKLVCSGKFHVKFLYHLLNKKKISHEYFPSTSLFLRALRAQMQVYEGCARGGVAGGEQPGCSQAEVGD